MVGKKSEQELVEIPLETYPEMADKDVTTQAKDEKIVEAEAVQVNQSNISQVNAEKVEFQQGSAARVYADQVTVRQGGVGITQATSANVSQSGVGIVRASDVTLEKCSAQAVIAQTAIENGGTTGLLIAREVHANPIRAFVVLAQNIDGQVETTLDTRGAILAGVIAGIAAGLVGLVGRLLSNRKR